MKTLSLYRGIAVPSARVDAVVAAIESRGLRGDEGDWKFQVPDVAKVRADIEALFARPDLTIKDIFQSTPFLGICACGTSSGGEYYAAKHNFSTKNDYPLTIEFEAALDKIYVDPRDFLCTAFQLWDSCSMNLRASQAALLSELFGPRILRYFESACQVRDQTHRIAMCNLAAFDPEVVSAHYANRKVIAGRYGTSFASAFFVQTPVPPERIRRLYTAERNSPSVPDVSLSRFLGRLSG